MHEGGCVVIKSPVKKWTDAKFKGWIISLLRRGTMKFPPRNECLKAAKTEKKINEKTGRMAQHFKCAGCGGECTSTNVVADHISPVVDPDVGFIDWNTYIERMFCPVDNLQVLCNNGENSCHHKKTKQEREWRKNGKISQDI